MNGKTIVAALAMGACFGVAAPAMAAACATLTVSPGAPAIPTWNPLNPVAQEATFTATLTRASANTASVKLIFIDADSSATPMRLGTIEGPRYLITNMDTGTRISVRAGANVRGYDVPLTQFGSGPGDTVSINMKATIPANIAPREDFIGGNTYTETFDYSVQCFNSLGQEIGVDNSVGSNLTLSVTIPKLVSIITAKPKTINFGNFTTDVQSALIVVRSTSTLNVAVSTSMGRKMVREGAVAPYPSNSVIAYSMKFNGVAIAGDSPLINQTRAGVLGASFPLELTLTDGVPTGKLAGKYTDTITLTITPGV